MHSTNLSGYSSESEIKEEEVKQKKINVRCREVVINGIVVKDYMTSNDLNECVSDLLKKEKPAFLKNNIKRVIKYNPTGKEKEKKKRYRKDKGQFACLQIMYDENSNWDKEEIKRISNELGLKESQIYKSNCDQRKKNNHIIKQDIEMDLFD